MTGLETGRIDKHELVGAFAADAGDAVARGLRLARGDADLLADQRIQQRGLAHIGLADDGNQPAMRQACALPGFGRRNIGSRRTTGGRSTAKNFFQLPGHIGRKLTLVIGAGIGKNGILVHGALRCPALRVRMESVRATDLPWG